MAKKGMPKCLIVELDEESAARLSALAVHENVYCHHLTIAFKPDAATLREYRGLIGQQITLVVTGIAQDEKGQVVYIPIAKSRNERPHITISAAEGVGPEHSNLLLQTAEAGGTIEPLAMQLTGEVKLVSLRELQLVEVTKRGE